MDDVVLLFIGGSMAAGDKPAIGRNPSPYLRLYRLLSIASIHMVTVRGILSLTGAPGEVEPGAGGVDVARAPSGRVGGPAMSPRCRLFRCAERGHHPAGAHPPGRGPGGPRRRPLRRASARPVGRARCRGSGPGRVRRGLAGPRVWLSRRRRGLPWPSRSAPGVRAPARRTWKPDGVTHAVALPRPKMIATVIKYPLSIWRGCHVDPAVSDRAVRFPR